jgi:hypothetical protein
MTALSPIKFIPFEKLKELGSTPRFRENRNLCVVLEEIDLETSLLIFVSHCWLRGYAGAKGWDGRPHPDNAEGGKYNLIVEGVEKMLKELAPIYEKLLFVAGLWLYRPKWRSCGRTKTIKQDRGSM